MKPKFDINLQFFSEKGLDKQSSNQLRRGIETLKVQISLHKQKISNPRNFYPDWDSLDMREQEGSLRHWRKELKNFTESINNRIVELEKRGESYD